MDFLPEHLHVVRLSQRLAKGRLGGCFSAFWIRNAIHLTETAPSQHFDDSQRIADHAPGLNQGRVVFQVPSLFVRFDTEFPDEFAGAQKAPDLRIPRQENLVVRIEAGTSSCRYGRLRIG